MKWMRTFAWVAPILWAIQLVAFIMLFGSVFTRLTVQCFTFVGLPVRETSVNAFLTGLVKILSWPIRPLFSSTWTEGSFITNVLLLALNSLLWSSAIATVVYFFTKPKNRPAHS